MVCPVVTQLYHFTLGICSAPKKLPATIKETRFLPAGFLETYILQKSLKKFEGFKVFRVSYKLINDISPVSLAVKIEQKPGTGLEVNELGRSMLGSVTRVKRTL